MLWDHGAALEEAAFLQDDTLSSPGTWMVLQTRARQEKAIARQLTARRSRFVLPLVPRVTLIRGRKFTSQVPLFPGYIFLCGQREEAFHTITTKRVCRIIDVPDQQTFLHELSQIMTALQAGAPLDLHPFAVEGRRCRIIRGPFMGLEGVVIQRKSMMRLVLQIGILGRGAALEIDADFLEPID